MPLHSIRSLPEGAVLGLWHLTEPPGVLWPLLADATHYHPLLPARADGPRQAQWLAGRVLVQHLLQASQPAVSALPSLQNDDAGRPFLLGAGLQPALSLSHSGQWVAVLLATPGAAVGIDVEVVRDKAQRLAHKFLNETELAAVAALLAAKGTDVPSPAGLYSLLWSAKETLYKLAGKRGIIFRENLLLDLPAGFLLPAGTLPAQLWLPGCNSRHHICYLTPEAGYVLTYCVSPSLS